MQIAQSTLLITGGGSGLGAACARQFASLGANVVLADLNATTGAALAAEFGSSAAFAQCDVCSAESMQAAIDLACERFGGIQGVICCAGILAAARVVSREGPHDLDLFRRVIEVNLIGSFNAARLAAAAMQRNSPNAQGERGVILLTSSVSAFEGQIGQAAYAASKGGVASLTLPLARELGKHGIRVVSLAPGVMNTPMMQAAPDAVRQSLESQVPFPPRLGEPQEFASLAAHVFENAYMNGTTIRIDGAIRMGAK